MTDDRVLEYLRSRGAAAPPADLVRSVMAAVDADPGQRSRFGAALPVLVAAGAATVIFVLALLFGFGRDIGPAPTPFATPSPDAMDVTVEELQQAVAAAVDVLRDSPGVEGTGTSHVLGELGSATWFSWRPGGDQVVVTRMDVDVTQTAWWLDPDGGPPARGENVATTIQVLSGDTHYRAAAEIGGEVGWTIHDRFTAPDVLGVPFPAILDGVVEPWESSFATSVEGEASVESPVDGGALWTLTRPFRTGSVIDEFDIGPDGALRSMSTEYVDVEPNPEDAPLITSTLVELTVLEDPDPIPAPDVDAAPDPTDFGLPADFPLIGPAPASPPAGGPLITDDPECVHTSGAYRVTLPLGWWTNVAFEDPELGDISACEYLAPAEFDPTSATPDRPIPDGVALRLMYVDGGCVGSFLATLSTRETMVDGHPASITEYAQGTEADDPPGGYEYVVNLAPEIDCELGGRFILAATGVQMADDYESNKAILDHLMSTMEIEP